MEGVRNEMDNRAINMASVIAADSFYSGANWGFLLEENPEFESILSILNNSNVKKIRVDNGYIVFCDYEYLKNVIARVEPLTEEVLVKYRTRLQREVPELQKLLTSVLRKNCKYLDDCGSYYELNIGLYCTNNMNKMRINGIEYPAFTLSLSEALKEIVKLSSRLSIYIYVSNGFDKLNNVLASEALESIYSGLEIASSGTGAFLTLRFEK